MQIEKISEIPVTAILIWSDGSGKAAHELEVTVLEEQNASALIRVPQAFEEHTEVVLLKGDLRWAGSVTSCIRSGKTFLLGLSLERIQHDRDPGALMVGDFVSEEAEDRILNELAQELSSQEPDGWEFMDEMVSDANHLGNAMGNLGLVGNTVQGLHDGPPPSSPFLLRKV